MGGHAFMLPGERGTHEQAIENARAIGSALMIFVERGKTEMKGGPTVKSMRGTVVLDENGKVVQPGSDVVGRIARSGNIPLEYYKDPVKTAETFIRFIGCNGEKCYGRVGIEIVGGNNRRAHDHVLVVCGPQTLM